MLNTPVLFLIFNRPDTTARVFNTIRETKPKQIFIAADGPRENIPADEEKCRQVREIVSQIDWECDVKTLYRDSNLGCKYAISSAIDWFFEQVEEGIILEDDCLPCKEFFDFCSLLLAHYKYNDKIMHIGGANFQLGKKRGKGSYYFSAYGHVWGWATWRRAWQYYKLDINMFEPMQLTDNIIRMFSHKSQQQYWIQTYKQLKQNHIDTWDYQWNYSMWSREGIAIIPNGNLISNIGFGPEATHTYHTENRFSEMETVKFNISNLLHPDAVVLHKPADYFTYKIFINQPTSVQNKIRNFAYQHLPENMLMYLRKLKTNVTAIIP